MRRLKSVALATMLVCAFGVGIRAGDIGTPGLLSSSAGDIGTPGSTASGDMGSPGDNCDSTYTSSDVMIDILFAAITLY
jgi:hypothetical protein